MEDSSRWNQCDQHWQDMVSTAVLTMVLSPDNSKALITITGRRLFLQLASSPRLTTQPISVSFPLVPTGSALSSNSPLTPVPSPLQVVLPLVTSPTTSPVHSKSPASSSLPTPAPMLKLSRRPATSTSQSSLSVIPTRLPSLSTLPFPPTTRAVTPLG